METRTITCWTREKGDALLIPEELGEPTKVLILTEAYNGPRCPEEHPNSALLDKIPLPLKTVSRTVKEGDLVLLGERDGKALAIVVPYIPGRAPTGDVIIQ